MDAVMEAVVQVMGPDALVLFGAAVGDEGCALPVDASAEDRAFCFCGGCGEPDDMVPAWAQR